MSGRQQITQEAPARNARKTSTRAGSVNKVILIGNCGADPEIRRTQDGKPIASLRIASSEQWRDRNSGERKEKTEWHTVVVFNILEILISLPRVPTITAASRRRCRFRGPDLGTLLQPNTIFFLMAQYGGQPIISLDVVCRDYFSHLPVDKFLRKVSGGQIEIPIVQMEPSQKSHRGIHIHDLAEYIDRQRDLALADYEKVCRSR